MTWRHNLKWDTNQKCLCMNIITAALISISMFGLLDLNETNPIIILFFFAVFFILKTLKYSFFSLTHWNSISAFFTFLCTIVNAKDWISKQWFNYTAINTMVIIVYSLCNMVGLYLLFNLIVKEYILRASKLNIRNDAVYSNKYKFLLICFLLILISQLISFCTYYPGIVTNDSYNQISQALGMIPFNNHHPIAHSLIIKCCIEPVYFITGNMNMAVAGYSIFQMLCLTGTMVYLLNLLYTLQVKRKYIIFVILYFIIIPYHSIYSQMMGKDIPFAIFVSLFIISLYKITQFQKEHIKIYDYLLLFLSGMGFCLFRSNGIIAFIIVLITVFIVLRKNKIVPIILSSAFICSIIILGPVFGLFSAGGPDTIESLSLPLQQIGKVICEGKVNDEEYLMLDKIMDVQQVEKTYDENFSDPMKNLVRSTGDQTYLKQNIGKYFKIYVQLGLKNPRKYFKAFLSQTMGYWYPDVEPYIWNTDIRQNTIGIKRDSFFPIEVAKVIENIQTRFLCFPILGLFKSIGFEVWVLLLQLSFCIYYGNKKMILYYMPVLAIILTLILGSPYWCTLRYSYAMFLCFPVIYILGFYSLSEKAKYK